MSSLTDSYRAMPHLLPWLGASSPLMNRARTQNGYAFLESEAEYIFLVDSDMMWVPQSLIRLLQTAKENKLKAVSGFTFMQPQGRIVPHAYQLIPNRDGGYARSPYAVLPSTTEPFEVNAVGGACFLVHRDVYEALLPLSAGKTAYPWQEEVYDPRLDAQIGEDLVFCQRIRAAGFSIWYEPRAVFLHAKKAAPITLDDYTAFLDREGIAHPYLRSDEGNAA